MGDYFVQVLYRGKTVNLVLRRTKWQTADAIVDMHTIKSLVTKNEYFLVDEASKAPVEVKSDKSIIKQYPDLKRQIKANTRQKHLKFSDSKMEYGLTESVRALDRFLNTAGTTGRSMPTQPLSIFYLSYNPLIQMNLVSLQKIHNCHLIQRPFRLQLYKYSS